MTLKNVLNKRQIVIKMCLLVPLVFCLTLSVSISLFLLYGFYYLLPGVAWLAIDIWTGVQLILYTGINAVSLAPYMMARTLAFFTLLSYILIFFFTKFGKK